MPLQVTMVFCGVDGAGMLRWKRADARQEVHQCCSHAIRETLRVMPEGYLCREQPGDLKYMVAFSSAKVRAFESGICLQPQSLGRSCLCSCVVIRLHSTCFSDPCCAVQAPGPVAPQWQVLLGGAGGHYLLLTAALPSLSIQTSAGAA